MRRSLVLTDETARHPFRASLPPHLKLAKVGSLRGSSWRGALALTADDIRGFATSYIACLIAVAVFIF